MKVQVLMSTYNGEKYLDEQIESILNQKGVEVSILIRDDGSQDSTVEILRHFAQSDPRIKCVFETNIGVKRSFLKLIQISDPSVDYYAFSDQDDVWFKDKLLTAVEMLEKEDKEMPLIYGSSVFLYTDGKVTGKRFICSQLAFGNFLIKNYYPGCTMVFNRRLKELVDFVDICSLKPNPLHDHWLNLVCTACGGKIIIDKMPHLLYRQHKKNVVGDRTIKHKLRENGLFGHSNNIRFKICQELHELYYKYEDKNSAALIQIVLKYQNGIKNRIRLIQNKEIRPTSFVERLLIVFIVMMGKF